MKEVKDIVIDFDGTCVTHEYPLVGRDIGAQPVLKALVDKGYRLILSTMRSMTKITKNPDGSTINDGKGELFDAVKWFEDNNIPLYGVQRNPTQHTWTDSPKAYGQIIIDDAALGCPLIYPGDSRHVGGDRPYVDWVQVEFWLKLNNII